MRWRHRDVSTVIWEKNVNLSDNAGIAIWKFKKVQSAHILSCVYSQTYSDLKIPKFYIVHIKNGMINWTENLSFCEYYILFFFAYYSQKDRSSVQFDRSFLCVAAVFEDTRIIQ